MANELLELLLRLALGASGAIGAALLLRRPLRHVAGADAAYLCWLMVPLAMLAAALPALQMAPAYIVPVAPGLAPAAVVAQVAQPGATGWVGVVLLAWAAGALGAGAMLVAGQRRFVRDLGALAPRDGVYCAAHSQHGPALLGLWRPIIVVPADFAQRYSAVEQALILAHERLHAERRDPLANAVLALLQCTFWFNPLMHFAASRFRFDQELACDAAVLARATGQRQAYAAAMLKTQSAGAPALATCHWQSSHPLKERIMQLKKTPVSTPRRYAGRAAVALLAFASVLATVAARAGDSPASGDYQVAVQFADSASTATPAILIKAGEPFKMNWTQPGSGWAGDLVVTPAKDDMVWVKMKITQENGEVISPSLLMRLGEHGAVSSGAPGGPSFKLGVTVTRPSEKAGGA